MEDRELLELAAKAAGIALEWPQDLGGADYLSPREKADWQLWNPLDLDTGDHVHHEPSGEDWVVAYVRGDRLAWCGWPQGEAALSDCTLLKKATPAERDKLLHEMADIGHDMRASYAKKRLAERYMTPNVF